MEDGILFSRENERERNDTVVMGAVQRRLESMYPYLKNQGQLVAFEASAMAEELDLSREQQEALRKCAYLMDVGMIDETIHGLVKDNTESGISYLQNVDIRRAVERHPVIGARKLEELGFPEEIVLAIRHHHEWYNGWGYPDGLTGVAIPLLARILSVADAYVSLVSDRPYRSGCTPQEALKEIASYTGVQFDPYVVPALETVVAQKKDEVETLLDRTLDLSIDDLGELEA